MDLIARVTRLGVILFPPKLNQLSALVSLRVSGTLHDFIPVSGLSYNHQELSKSYRPSSIDGYRPLHDRANSFCDGDHCLGRDRLQSRRRRRISGCCQSSLVRAPYNSTYLPDHTHCPFTNPIKPCLRFHDS